MLIVNIHKAVLINILQGIYSDPALRNILGFKGGTAAMLFYELPRFSVDLDFDLLDSQKQEEVFMRMKELLTQFGEVKEATNKRYTLFFLLSYKKGERTLKVEVSIRPTQATFTPKSYLGISVLVMTEEDMFAGKLAATLTRIKFASRDLYDLWFFLKNRWPINEKIVTEKTGLSVTEALKKAENQASAVKKTELLAGLGDLLDKKQKDWTRERLIEELVFQLRKYRETLM